MSTKLQQDKKETKQVRISTTWHKRLKIEAAQKGLVMSSLLDELCDRYFSGATKETQSSCGRGKFIPSDENRLFDEYPILIKFSMLEMQELAQDYIGRNLTMEEMEDIHITAFEDELRRRVAFKVIDYIAEITGEKIVHINYAPEALIDKIKI